MKKNNTAFLTTIFPKSIEFLIDFLDSLSKQTNQQFDLLVVNDGVEEFNRYAEKFPELNIIEITSCKNPVENRIVGLKQVIKSGYENLIFGDSDDYFKKNRVELAKKALKKNDIFVNDLSIARNDHVLDNVFGSKIYKSTSFEALILQSNIFGLSNTAINVSVLSKIDLKIPNHIIAFDWFLFSILIVLEERTVCFSSDTSTYYRQHNNNTIGLHFKLDQESFHNELEIKKTHLHEMKNYCLMNNQIDNSLIFDKELKSIQELEIQINHNSELPKYLKIVNNNIEAIFNGWWSRILTIDKYKNLNENKDK